MPNSRHTYGQILRSSSIIGGAQVINYLIGMARTKLVAILLGPSGVGLVGLYLSATGLIGTVTGLGIGASGVREVAEAYGSGDLLRAARTVKTLRYACWISGALGWVMTAALSWLLSVSIFGSGEHARIIALLGCTLLIGAVSGGQMALIQGARRIGDLARLSVIGTLAGTVVSLGLYGWLRERGIVPALVVTAVVNLGFSWWFARKVPVPTVSMPWRETWRQSRKLVSLGTAFLCAALATSAIALVSRSLIVRRLGLEAAGVYQAAWSVSGLFAEFILNAMGTDFYPRLTSVANDHDAVNRLVNEQTEIGVLLALPGLLGTLVLAPWVMGVLYSAKFLPGADLLPWFVLGVFCRVIFWPMAFIPPAKGASAWYASMETVFALVHIGLVVGLLTWLGLPGVAVAFALAYLVFGGEVLFVAAKLTGFRCSPPVWKLLGLAAALILAEFISLRVLPRTPGFLVGIALTFAACLFSLRGLSSRLGLEHRLVRLACKIPGGRLACGL